MRYLSTKGRYGTRVLLDLALHWGEGPILLRDIAGRQEVPLPYLEHLIAPLIAGGIVKSFRGPRGGVLLAKRPEDVKLSEVVQLLEGSISLVKCLEEPEVYSRASLCVTRDVWDEVNKAVFGVLESTTLQDLAMRQRQKWSLGQIRSREKTVS